MKGGGSRVFQEMLVVTAGLAMSCHRTKHEEKEKNERKWVEEALISFHRELIDSSRT